MSRLYLDAGLPASGQKVMLATTAYDAPAASYTFSIQKSRGALTAAGIASAYLLLSGNCHVDDARNTVVQDFLLSDCTDLVFLDADVSWNEEDLVTLCQFDMDVVGGVYPYRRRAKAGNGSMPVRALSGAPGSLVERDGLIEVEGLPTGFLRIRRHVLEKLAAEAGSFFNRKNTESLVPLIFERTLEDGARWGGDINFCRKWRAMGGQCFAATEFRLGHEGKDVFEDSLGAYLRRAEGKSLSHVCERIREGKNDLALYLEAIDSVDNPWGAQSDVLAPAVMLARRAKGPILEAGSGLSTILMAAAAPERTVWALEHSRYYADRTAAMAQVAGITNIALVVADLKDGWYDLTEDRAAMPDSFALALVDGPPRIMGDRMKFFADFGASCDLILADDADDKTYLAKLEAWAKEQGRVLTRDEFRAALIGPIEKKEAAA